MSRRTRSTLPLAVAGATALIAALACHAGPAGASTMPLAKSPPPFPAAARPATSGPAQPAALVQGYTVRQFDYDYARYMRGGVPVACPSGSKVVGGGAVLDPSRPHPGLIVEASTPASDGGGWGVAFFTGSRSQHVYAHAICASQVPGYQVVVGSPVSVPTHTQTQATVSCPTGTVPYAGGGETGSTLDYDAGLNSSIPLTDGWRVDANNNGDDVESVTPYVVCGAQPTGYRQVVDQKGVTIPALGRRSDRAVCPAGLSELGGGSYSDSADPGVFLFQTDTLSAVTGGHGWTASVYNGSSVQSRLYTSVICAQVVG